MHAKWAEMALAVWRRYIGAVIPSRELLDLLNQRSGDAKRAG